MTNLYHSYISSGEKPPESKNFQNIHIFHLFTNLYHSYKSSGEKPAESKNFQNLVFQRSAKADSEGNGLKSPIKTAAPKIATTKPSPERIADDVSEQQTTKSSAK